MRRSDNITTLAKALVEAKKKMEAPTKNKINPHFKSAYADLSGIKASYQAALGEHRLSIVHAIAPTDGHLVLTTTLLHDSGEWIASDYPIPAYSKPQEQGSALTYFKRYNVCALLDIVAEDDDDGEAAQAGTTKAAVAKPAPTPATKNGEGLSRDDIEKVHAAAKKAGLKNVAELAPVLGRILPGVEKASDISPKDLRVVLDALTGMARESVPA